MAFPLHEEIERAPLPTLDHMLGKGSMMPFNSSNSGSRKLMFGINLEHMCPIIDPDVPVVETGYEFQFGQYSSSFTVANDEYEILAIIPKFKYKPKGHNFYIMVDSHGQMDVVESCSYKHLTESYGYLYATSPIDSMTVGSVIAPGTPLLRSTSFDDYGNRMDGKNLTILYDSSEQTMEDGIRISESCAQKLSSPLVHKIRVAINDNDIPLNIYGTRDLYKIFPDIGEKIKHSIVMAYRREKKEESLFSQSYDRLMDLIISDEKIFCSGTIVDIDVYSNDPSKLDSVYHSQLKFYYDQQVEFAKSIVSVVDHYVNDGCTMKYDLQKLYHKCIGIINGKQYFNERVYSGINLDITVIETIPVLTGDKLTNRYGGKGVVSEIRPDHLMPKTYDGEVIDIQANSYGIYGRENLGQLFELTVTSVGRELLKYWGEESVTTADCLQMYLDYLEIVAPSQFEEAQFLFENKSDDFISEFIGSMVIDGRINVCINPVSENMNIDKVAALYRKFPWIEQQHVQVPLPDSNGKIQYVSSRRPVVVGDVYYYRLKQYAKEKFSVTSLSATNIRNENSRNKASKVYKALYSRTPIRFGDMEIGNMLHLGPEITIQMLMLYATSPLARQLYESLMTNDPFEVDIKLDDTSSNRNAEIVEVYLKTIGKRIEFRKIPKKINTPIKTYPIKYAPKKNWIPVTFYAEGQTPNYEHLEYRDKKLKPGVEFYPVVFFQPPEEIDKLVEQNRLKWQAELERLEKEEQGE